MDFQNFLDQTVSTVNEQSLPTVDYFDNPALSSTYLKFFYTDGAHAYWNKVYNTSADNSADDENQAFLLGSLVHCMILEPDTMDDKYVIFRGSRPNSKQKKEFARLVSEADDLDILTCYDQCYKPTGTDATRRIKANELCQELMDYIRAIKTSKDKIMMDWFMMNTARQMESSVRKNKFVRDFLNYSQVDTELEIYFNKDGIDMKSKVDWLIRDDVNKRLIYIDIKTTKNSHLNYFKEAVEHWSYDLQMAFYEQAIRSQLKDWNLEDYDIEFYWIAISTTAPYSTNVFRVSDATLASGRHKFNRTFESFKEFAAKGSSVEDMWIDDNIKGCPSAI